MGKTWDQLASEVLDGFAQEWSTEAGRKAYRAGDGQERAKAFRRKLEELKQRVEKFI